MFIFEVRDLWPELPKAMGVIKNPFILFLMDILEKVSYYFSNLCIGLSPGIVEGIKRKSKNKTVYLIPNSSDLDLVKEIDFQIKKEFIAVFTGAHGYANGLEAVLYAAKELIKLNRLDIKIQFIGDGILKNKLKKIVNKEQLINCNFLDPMPKKDLFKYLQINASVGLMILKDIPAFYEGTSPNKFFDYIALGLPVINNYPGWIAQIIKDKNCGIPIKPNNPVLFANSLIRLKDNPEILKVMSKNCKLLAKQDYSRDQIGKDFINIFNS